MVATIRRTSQGAWSSALLAVLGTFASAARADVAPATQPANEGHADRLFQSGKSKFDGGDFAAACEDLSESLKLDPKLGTLLNLALCHETIGKAVTAWSEFSHAAVWAVQNGQHDRYEFAVRHVRSLEPRLPRVVLQLPPNRAIEGLDLDGEPVPEARWYLPLFLDSGEHHLAITAPGKQRTTVAFRVTTSPSDQLVYVPALADDSTNSTKATVDPTRRLLGIIGLGLGAGGVAVGTTFGALAIAAEDRDPAVKDRATVATVAFIAGAAFAAAGGWLVWTSTQSRTRVAVTPMALREGASLMLTTSF